MARTYLVFGDIEGKLDVLRVECIKCPRKSRYSVPRLIENTGRKPSRLYLRENADCFDRSANAKRSGFHSKT